MALQFTYTDQTGTTHDQSYWRVVFVAVDLLSKTARAVAAAYHDAAAFQTGKRPLDTREVTVVGDDFTNMMTAYQSGQTDLFALAYTVGKTQYEDFATATEV